MLHAGGKHQDRYGVPYVSPDGVTGFTVQPKSSEEMAAALNRLLDNPSCDKRWDAPRAIASSTNSESAEMAARTLDLYQRCYWRIGRKVIRAVAARNQSDQAGAAIDERCVCSAAGPADLARLTQPSYRRRVLLESIKLTPRAESSQHTSTAGWIPLALGLSAVILLWDFLQLPQILDFRRVRFQRSRAAILPSIVPGVSRLPANIRFRLSVRTAGLYSPTFCGSECRSSDAGRIPGRFNNMPTRRGLCDRKNRRALEFRPIQLIFLFVAIGRAVIPTYWNLSHGLEAVLICLRSGRTGARIACQCARTDDSRSVRKAEYGRTFIRPCC